MLVFSKVFTLIDLFPCSRYTSVYNEYQGVLETHVERLIADCGVTTEQFFLALKYDWDNEESESAVYVEIILAAAEYPNFISMMKEYKQKLASDAAK